MKKLFLLLLLLAATLLYSAFAFGFGEQAGACEGDCAKCHPMTVKEAEGVLDKIYPGIEVTDMKLGPMPGAWELYVKYKDKRGLLYLGFSKRHIFQGVVINAITGENITGTRMKDISRVDVSKIPLDDALVLGNKNAKYRVVVFDDPDWQYCGKLHQVMEKVVEKRKDIVFFIKMLPLVKIHPDAYEKSKAIVCSKSMEMLKDAFDKKPIGKPTCKTNAVDETMRVAREIGVTGTPTLVLPDGTIQPGSKNVDKLIEIITK